jgi:hypothetical protein
MAGMAGIAASGLSASLSSAVHENPLPCARYPLLQGFDPVHVSSWGETGGIPEEAAPFILNHYGMLATSPSETARLALLAFSRVGINAYLKEKLGIKLQGSSQERDDWAWRLDICQRIGIEFDERDKRVTNWWDSMIDHWGQSPYLEEMARLEGREWLLELTPEKFAGNSANYFTAPSGPLVIKVKGTRGRGSNGTDYWLDPQGRLRDRRCQWKPRQDCRGHSWTGF